MTLVCWLKAVIVINLVIFATACQLSQFKAETPSSAEVPSKVQQSLQVQQTPVPTPKPKPLPTRREIMVDKLMRQAQQAFRENRLAIPKENNAYDRFHAILILDPQNAQARAGLQAILLRYGELIRQAIAKGNIGLTQSLLNQAETYYPANELLMDYKSQLRKLQRELANNDPMFLNNSGDHEDFMLDAYQLSKRSGKTVDALKQLAQRIRKTDESILIYARNDAEGRWIYKQMKSSVPGYRVRGDIRVAKTPKIRIMPPL